MPGEWPEVLEEELDEEAEELVEELRSPHLRRQDMVEHLALCAVERRLPQLRPLVLAEAAQQLLLELRPPTEISRLQRRECWLLRWELQQ